MHPVKSFRRRGRILPSRNPSLASTSVQLHAVIIISWHMSTHIYIYVCVYIHDMLQVHWSKLVIIESVDQTLVKAPVFFSFFIIPTPCPSDWPDVRFSSAAISLSNNFLWNVCMRVCMYVFLWTTEEDGIRQNFDESWSFN